MAGPGTHRKPITETKQNLKDGRAQKPPSWSVMRGIFGCKHIQPQPQPQPQPLQKKQKQKETDAVTTTTCGKKPKKMKCSGSLCSNTKVTQKPELIISASSPESRKRLGSNNSTDAASSRSMKSPLQEAMNSGGGRTVSATNSSLSVSSVASSSIGGSSFRGMPFRRFSGCYECRMVVDPVLGIARDPSLRGSICSCPDCGEIFMKAESLELHQAVRHAVSELGPEDTSKNIVEIIFQSSWLRKQTPICKIDRILKVHNTSRTISKFEEYRDAIKARATKLPKKHPRCVADGNELLRFHCTTLSCSLGLNGSSNLCNSVPTCTVCNIIKNGFKAAAAAAATETGGRGILTTATSGRAHDKAAVEGGGGDEKRAMLVCRVIAGRVKKSGGESGGGGSMVGSVQVDQEYDSLAGAVGVYSNLDELYVFNPKAILPCFVVIYGGY